MEYLIPFFSGEVMSTVCTFYWTLLLKDFELTFCPQLNSLFYYLFLENITKVIVMEKFTEIIIALMPYYIKNTVLKVLFFL